ncbi:hypothetical protein ODJ79_23350 [Actinoplanes sp. KI2]|uniref:hypothetical protein n=1 Tax=Actinoplanes sp. KI2 TaxID=2983315 RepID=UPI0021D5B1FF|nr:hypothetical protein [Actinoplanes sp. KI2]MCU7726679.1 hypothetical protein [Actinoplanes sp. KI2]
MADETMIDEKAPSRWAAAGRTARWLLGALSLVCGFTWILLTVHGTSAAGDLTVGTVFAVAGLVLLMPHRIRLPRLVTTLVMVMVAIAGTAAGLARGTERVSGMYAYIADRGFPVTWAQRGAIADDVDTAERLAHSANWTVDLISLATNLLFWAYTGMILVVIAVLIRRKAGESRR